MSTVSDRRDFAADAREPIVGTAGWGIPRAAGEHFESAGTHLERYARVLLGTEINTSFYRSHAPSTYERWARATPAHFKFSLKLPRQITHTQRLRAPAAALRQFLDETAALGDKRAVILVQLPPSLDLDLVTAQRFFECMRDDYSGPVVCEPRHPSWFTAKAEALWSQFSIGRVAADPPVTGTDSDMPAGAGPVAYFRLHGSPRPYWSSYGHAYLERLARTIDSCEARQVWCIFDNTASGAAASDALALRRLLGSE